MKILVSGGAGFIGSHLVDALIEKKHQVLIIDDLSTGKKEFVNPQAKFYKLDIQDKKLEEVFKKEKPEIVFHQAAQIDLRQSVEDPIEDAQINILGSLNLLENCKKYKVKRFIFASTGGALYGDLPKKYLPTAETQPPQPLSPYSVAKLTIEYYLNYYYQVFNLPYLSLRYANVYGPRQNPHGEAGVVAIFINKILSGRQPVINGDGQQTRDYVYVTDVVRANLLALRNKKVGSYNVGAGKETNVNQIFQKIVKALGQSVKEVHGPAKPGEQQRSCLDWHLIKKDLGWQPEVDLDKGIKKTVEWFSKK